MDTKSPEALEDVLAEAPAISEEVPVASESESPVLIRSVQRRSRLHPQPHPLSLDMLLSIESVESYKKPNCVTYEKCLDRAYRMGWSQFHCNGCHAYEKREVDHSDFALAKNLSAILDLA
jgi:hypothetical protein